MTELTAEYLRDRLHYDQQTGIFTWLKCGKFNRRWIGKKVGTPGAHGYLIVILLGRTRLLHRLAWLYVHGKWPAHEIDHIDGNPSNNAICNLREASQSQNTQNQRKAHATNGTGLLGVEMHGKRYSARITVDGKSRRLGSFGSADEAHAAYVMAKRQFHPFGTI